jgi:hypothetical protein
MNGFAGAGMGFLDPTWVGTAALRVLEEGRGRVGRSLVAGLFFVAGRTRLDRDGPRDAESEEDEVEDESGRWSTCIPTSGSVGIFGTSF